MDDKTTQLKVIAGVGIMLLLVGIMIALTNIVSNNKIIRHEQNISLMKLCLAEEANFEHCKFLVYGGIKITRRDAPAVETE